MSPSEIRKATLKQLRETRKSMMSTRWTLSLEKKDEETQARAAKELLRVHHAIQKLENQQLADIRDKLLENEADLAAGREKLAAALQDLKKTKTVLKSVSGLISIVARVLPLLAL